MPGRREFLKAFYAKYAPDQQLSEERFNAIDQKYQDDATLLKDLYSKYAPKENLSDERIDAIRQKYELSPVEKKSQVLENGLTEEQDREKNLNQLNQDYFNIEPTVPVQSDATNIAPPSELKSATRSEMLELNKISEDYEKTGASQTLGSFNKAVVEGVAALPKSVGILAKKLDDLTGAQSKKIEDYPTYQAGQWLEDKALQLGITATDPTQNEFYTSQVPSALGSVASILLTGMGGLEGQAAKELAVNAPKTVLGQAGKAAAFAKNPATVSGGLQMAVPEYEAAKEKGLSDDEAFTVFLKNYAVGQTEALPLASAFSKINKLAGGKLIDVLKAGGTQGLEEATQEVIQNYFTNQIAQGSYDPERDPMMGLLDAAKTGFFVGFILPGLGAALKNASHEDRAKVNSFINQKLKDKANQQPNESGGTGGVQPGEGAATTQTVSEPVQLNAEEQNQQANQEPIQQSVDEVGQPGTVEPPAVLNKPFEIRGQTKFYHASSKPRKGRLNPGTAPQFGQGIYFSTDKQKVTDEFGDNVSEVELKIEKPVQTGTKEYNDVEQLALDNYNKTLPVDEEGSIEGEKVDAAEIPSKYISDAAKQLGYDAIIDNDENNYGNEIVVLDESKIVYPEDAKEQPKGIKSGFESNIEALINPETGLAATVRKIDVGQEQKDAFLKRIGLTKEEYFELNQERKDEIQNQWTKSKEFKELNDSEADKKNPAGREGESKLATPAISTPNISKPENIKSTPTDSEKEALKIAKLYNDEVRNPSKTGIELTLSKVMPASVNIGKYGDKNTIRPGMAKSYKISKKGTPIDLVAKEASNVFDGTDTSITPDDVWNFMTTYNSGPKTLTTPAGNSKLADLANKFSAITGKAINRKTAQDYIDRIRKKYGEINSETVFEKYYTDGTLDVQKLKADIESNPDFQEEFGLSDEDFDRLKQDIYEQEIESRGSSPVRSGLDQPADGQRGQKNPEGSPLQTEFGDQTTSAQQRVTEITSKPLTHVPGLNMGKGISAGTYLSSEEENRYEGEPQKATVSIDNPFVFSGENSIIPLRNKILKENRDQFTPDDLEDPFGTPETIDDLSDSGIDKLAEMVREQLRAEGFDSIYLPETETQEGELIVFDRNKVTIGQGPEIQLQDQQPAGDVSGTGQGSIENDPAQPASETPITEVDKVEEPPVQEPPPPVEEKEPEPNKKERKVAKRYMADPDVSDEIKSGLSKEGRYYIPKTDLGSQAEADAYIEEKGIDQAIDDITDPDNAMSDRNRVFIGKTIYRLLKEEIQNSENPNAVRNKINRLLENVAKLGTTAGQTVQAFANMFTSDADQVAYTLQKDYDRQRNTAAEYAEPQIASLQSLVDQATDEALRDLLNDPRIKKLLEESRANENVRQTKRKQFTKRILDKLDEIEKQIDDSGKNKLFMDVTFGLAPLAYKAAINIIRAAVKAGDSLIDAVEKAVSEVNLNNKSWDEDGFRKLFEAEIKEEGKRDRKTLLEVLSNSGDTFKSLAQAHYKNYAGRKKSIQQLLQDELGLDAQEAERLGKTLDKIVGEKRKKIIETKYGPKIKTPKAKRVSKTLADKIEEFTNLGVLNDKNLREAYLASIDLPAITDQQSTEMERLVQEAESKPNGFARYEAIQRLIRYHQKITPLNWMEVGESIWYANMLSGISTQALNFQANSVATMAETLISIPQSIFEYKDPKAAFKNFAFMLRGMADGYKRNLAESANVLQNGYQPMKGGKFDESSFRGVKTSKGSILETLDNPLKYWKYVGRLMAATDILFYGGLKGMRAHQLAFRNAYNQNKNTVSQKMLNDAETILGETNNQVSAAQQKAASEGFTGRDLQRRTYEIMEQSWSGEMREDANSFASKGTYNYEPEGVLGIATGVINNATSKLPVLKTVVPFSRVISNVLNDYLNYTPWGLVRAAKGGMGIPGKGSYRKFSQEELLREKIKGVMGTAAMVALYAMTASDGDDEPFLEITADGTGNLKKNYELGETGWKQYSFKLRGTNTWFSYQNTPLAIPFAVIGYIRDSAKYKGEEVSEEKLGMILSGVIHYITDMSFMSGLSDFFEILSSKDIGSTAEKIGMFANRTVKTAVVPNLFTQVSRGVQEIVDSPMKRGDGLFGQYIRDIPMLRDTQGTMYNALGEPIVTETLYKFNPILTRLTSESDQEKKETYKVWNLIVENEAYIGAPSKATKIYDPKQGIERKFTEEEYQKFALKSGQNTRQMLLNYYASLAAMKDKKQVQKRITDIKEQARERAKSEMFQEMNSKY